MHAGGRVRRRHPPPVPRPQVARPAHPGADGYLGRVPRSIPVRGETENVSWLVTGAGPGVLVLVLVLAAVVVMVGSLLAWVRRPATMPAARARASRCQGRPCRVRAGTSRAARMSGHPARPAATGAGTYGRSAARSAYASTVPRGAQLGVGGRGGGITSHVPAVRPVRVGGGGDGPQAARICSSVRCGSVGSPRTVNGFTRWSRARPGVPPDGAGWLLRLHGITSTVLLLLLLPPRRAGAEVILRQPRHFRQALTCAFPAVLITGRSPWREWGAAGCRGGRGGWG